MKTPASGRHYIAGSWIEGQGTAFISKNPLDNQIVWQGMAATRDEVHQACEAAQAALVSWKNLAFSERALYLQQFAREVDKRQQELARLISLENGKPLWESLTEVNAVIGKVAISIEAYRERNAEKIISNGPIKACLRYKPHGVAAILGPFNFPAHLSNGHIVPALLAGNTVVLKPSELTPAVAELIIQCWHAAGIPAGVINCVQGDAATGQYLLADRIQAVYFTGSYAVGQRIHQQFGNKPEIILALEMGGNNPLIIDSVNDINAAVYQTLLSAFISSGQRCSCARRVLIPATAMGDQFLEKLLKAAKTLHVGAFDQQPEPFMGPVISSEHAQGHLKAQQSLLDKGGEALLPMKLLAKNSGLLSPGIIEMTAVDNPDDTEIFAPLIQLYRYQDFEQAIDLANQTRYGLAAGLVSDDPAHYQTFYERIAAGLINWNRPTTGADSRLPFGGIGYSGNHRPSAYFATDYCTYPIASQEQSLLISPTSLLPGIVLDE